MATLNLSKPLEKNQQVIKLSEEISEISFEFDISNALFERKGNNLIIFLDDEETSIILEDFYLLYSANSPSDLPNFWIDGELALGIDFFMALDPSLLPPPGIMKEMNEAKVELAENIFPPENFSAEKIILLDDNESHFLENWAELEENTDYLKNIQKPLLISNEFVDKAETLLADAKADEVLDLTTLKKEELASVKAHTHENKEEEVDLDSLSLEELKYAQNELEDLSNAFNEDSALNMKT